MVPWYYIAGSIACWLAGCIACYFWGRMHGNQERDKHEDQQP